MVMQINILEIFPMTMYFGKNNYHISITLNSYIVSLKYISYALTIHSTQKTDTNEVRNADHKMQTKQNIASQLTAGLYFKHLHDRGDRPIA